ncbi:MAG: hypothetical protein JWQ93_1489 [Marmoricola sp.]|jgi:hypothetical protein|nr:hypothetical protein [Marmoricola sp.]MCW2807534.1 hypothetical protein [Marmoricola sp.]MCW2836464.1 hypothetical protein [Marmoricola sp.]
MKLDIETTPTALRSAFVAPTLGGSVGGVCPQSGFRRVERHIQASFLAVGDAGLATGYRSWSPLIT